MILNQFVPLFMALSVRRYEPIPSNWRAQYSLGDLLKEYEIRGIS